MAAARPRAGQSDGVLALLGVPRREHRPLGLDGDDAGVRVPLGESRAVPVGVPAGPQSITAAPASPSSASCTSGPVVSRKIGLTVARVHCAAPAHPDS